MQLGQFLEQYLAIVGFHLIFQQVHLYQKDEYSDKNKRKDLDFLDQAFLEREKLVQNFLLNFENLYHDFKEGEFSGILNQWRKLSTTIGSTVEVQKRGRTIQGEAVGITRDGILVLEMDDGSLRKIISGECTHFKR